MSDKQIKATDGSIVVPGWWWVDYHSEDRVAQVYSTGGCCIHGASRFYSGKVIRLGCKFICPIPSRDELATINDLLSDAANALDTTGHIDCNCAGCKCRQALQLLTKGGE